jgi:hypothetical protein
MIWNESVIMIRKFSCIASDFWTSDMWMSFTLYEDIHDENDSHKVGYLSDQVKRISDVWINRFNIKSCKDGRIQKSLFCFTFNRLPHSIIYRTWSLGPLNDLIYSNIFKRHDNKVCLENRNWFLSNWSNKHHHINYACDDKYLRDNFETTKSEMANFPRAAPDVGNNMNLVFRKCLQTSFSLLILSNTK